jgi:hypothetical protein
MLNKWLNLENELIERINDSDREQEDIDIKLVRKMKN